MVVVLGPNYANPWWDAHGSTWLDADTGDLVWYANPVAPDCSCGYPWWEF